MSLDSLGYEVAIKFEYDIHKQKEQTLEFCNFIKENYPDLTAIPELSWSGCVHNQFTYFYKSKEYLENLKEKLENGNFGVKVFIDKIVQL